MNQWQYKLKQSCYSRIIDQHSHRPTERHPTLARTPLGKCKMAPWCDSTYNLNIPNDVACKLDSCWEQHN
jgi:hypothetical protein